ncbi:hypothetical protein OG21DRAFT_1203014 [Imleria badia]|nr:hypothetical protein OG21DRAFT_1203014 [Imleria badia]
MQDHRPCFILKLPCELQLRTFQNLSYKEILHCTQTCRSFQKIISTSMELQYRINSAAHCLRLLCVNDQPIHKRDQLLKEKIRALGLLNYNRVASPPLGTHDGRPDNTPRVSFVDGWLGVTYIFRDGSGARLFDCNGATPSLSRRAWTRKTLNPMHPSFALKQTVLDIRQDLLVAASVSRTGLVRPGQPLCHLELRTISGSQEDPHPLAAQGTLVSLAPWNVWSSDGYAENKLEVNGDFVAMLVSDCGHGGFMALLQVWNWKKGKTTVSAFAATRQKQYR